jgi:hypothetical protein
MTTTTPTPAGVRTPSVATAPVRGDLLLQGIRVVLALFGAFKLYGTVWFTFFATAEQGGDPQGAVDWSVAAWSFALAFALVVAAVRLRGPDRRTIQVVTGLLAVEIAFSVVKLTAYDEPEAVGFMLVDLLLVGLLSVAGRRRSLHR